MFCTKCGKELYEGDNFCASCGTRARAMEKPTPTFEDVVFNPPFKREAERRTAEISMGLEMEKSSQPAKSEKKKEEVSFNWNLDGFPSAQPRRTETVDFNWDSVIDRRSKGHFTKVETTGEKKQPAVLKWEEPAKTEITPELKKTIEPYEEIAMPQEMAMPQETAVTKEAEVPQETEVQKEAEVPKEAEILQEAVTSKEAAPKEVAEEEAVVEQAEPESEYTEAPLTVEELEKILFEQEYTALNKRTDDEAIKSTDQLEKFYTYNQKKEAFQELLDKEYERLRGMEEDNRPDAESLEYTWAGRLFPEKKVAEEAAVATPDGAEEQCEIQNDKDAGCDTEVETEAEPKPVADKTIDVSEVRKAARVQEVAKEKEEQVTPSSNSEQPINEQPADGQGTPESGKDRLGQKSQGTATAEDAEGDHAADSVDTDSTDSTVADAADKQVTEIQDTEAEASEKTDPKVTLAELFDDEEDEPKRMNIFFKLIITLLVILFVLEGTVLAVKLIAPESTFAVKSSEMVESLISMVTGAKEDADTDDEGSTAETNDNNVEYTAVTTTYISDIIESLSKPATIATVSEDVDLTYSLLQTYAYEEIAEAEEASEEDAYVETVIEAVVSYYDTWQETNVDSELIGINKLEIGEIRVCDDGYYVLCRLTYASSTGTEIICATAYVQVDDTEVTVTESKEETV